MQITLNSGGGVYSEGFNENPTATTNLAASGISKRKKAGNIYLLKLTILLCVFAHIQCNIYI